MLLNNENNNLNHVWVPKFRLTAKEVSSMLGICRDKLNRLQKEDKSFPKALKSGINRQSAVYFDYLEVMKWYENWKNKVRSY